MMGTWAKRSGLAVATTALVLGGLTGCGGDDDGGGSSAPDDASKEDFCSTFNGLYTDVMADVDPDDDSAAIKALKSWVDDMKEVGTPEDMPEDARKGFEVFIDEASKIDDDASMDDLDSLGDDLSDEDNDAAEAFGEWATDNCPMDLPSISPSS